MTTDPRIFAAAASDAYIDRRTGNSREPLRVLFGTDEYVVFGYAADSNTGFHATAYKEVAPPHNIIITYRGTDTDVLHHASTALKDADVDLRMVRDRVNPQEPAAARFTAEMIAKAAAHGIDSDHITVAGHSLGGTLAQIEASRHGLRGATFNAYGAVDLGYCVPEGGTQVTNYTMAGDVVSAAARHFGKVVPLASDADVAALKAGRYLGAARGAPPPNPLLAMRAADHGIENFVPPPGSGRESVLEPDVFAHYSRNYAEYRQAFEQFRGDAYDKRDELAAVLRQDSSRNLASTWANLSPDMRWQVVEYHAVNVDASIVAGVERHPLVAAIERGLDGGAAAARDAGQTLRALDERVASGVRGASAHAAPLAPVYGMLLGEAARLHGEVALATSSVAADRVEAARRIVERGARLIGEGAAAGVRASEKLAIRTADLGIDGWRDVRATADVVRAGAGVAAAAALARGHPGLVIGATRALYQRLKASMPGAADDRLMQVTAACHANGMTAETLGAIHASGRADSMIVLSTSPLVPPTTIDLAAPAPPAAQSLERMQQTDVEQSQVHARVQSELQAWELTSPPGPAGIHPAPFG